MRPQLFLNENSFGVQASHKHEAKQWVSALVDVGWELVRVGAKRALCHPAGISDRNLGANYNIRQWLNDKRTDIERRRFLRMLLTHEPYFESQSIADVLREVDSRYNGVASMGLGLAHFCGGVAVSLLSADEWRYPSLQIEVDVLNGSQEVVTERKDVRHAALVSHVESHRNWLRDKYFQSVVEREDLVASFPALFPSICLCAAAYKQISQLRKSDAHMKPLLKLLDLFQVYADSWDGGAFDASTLGCDASVESKATLNKYGAERTFCCPDGECRIFSWHAKFNPGAWRMYFVPDAIRKRFTVGYIGRHLPVVTG